MKCCQPYHDFANDSHTILVNIKTVSQRYLIFSYLIDVKIQNSLTILGNKKLRKSFESQINYATCYFLLNYYMLYIDFVKFLHIQNCYIPNLIKNRFSCEMTNWLSCKLLKDRVSRWKLFCVEFSFLDYYCHCYNITAAASRF